MAPPEQTPLLENKVTTSLNDEDFAQWKAACERANVQPADTLRKLAKAFVAHVQKHGRVSSLIRIDPKCK